MKPGTCGELLGQGWMALPWTKAALRHGSDGDEGVPTGANGWTLFFNAANFVGPVVFILPDLWSELSGGYREIVGRGHDARHAHVGSMAMEVAQGPHFEAQSGGATFTKIPRMDFPLDANGQSSLSKTCVSTRLLRCGTAFSRQTTAVTSPSVASWGSDPFMQHGRKNGLGPATKGRPAQMCAG